MPLRQRYSASRMLWWGVLTAAVGCGHGFADRTGVRSGSWTGPPNRYCCFDRRGSVATHISGLADLTPSRFACQSACRSVLPGLGGKDRSPVRFVDTIAGARLRAASPSCGLAPGRAEKFLLSAMALLPAVLGWDNVTVVRATSVISVVRGAVR